MIARIQLGRFVSGMHLDLMRAPLEGSQVRSFGFLSRSIPKLSEARGHTDPLAGRCSSAKEPSLISILGLIDSSIEKVRVKDLAVVKENIRKVIAQESQNLLKGRPVSFTYKERLDPVDFFNLREELYNKGIRIENGIQSISSSDGMKTEYNMLSIGLSKEGIEVLKSSDMGNIWKEGLNIESCRRAIEERIEKRFFDACWYVAEEIARKPNDLHHRIKIDFSDESQIGKRLLANLEKEGFEARIEYDSGSVLVCKNPRVLLKKGE